MAYDAFRGLMRATYYVSNSDLPKADWRIYLKNRPTLYAISPKGPNAVVRLTSVNPPH